MIRSSAPPASGGRRLQLIGRLKSHGVWVCVTHDQQLVLFHLVRAQEQMLFARMMASHILPTENFQQSVKLDVGQVLYSNAYELDVITKTTTTDLWPFAWDYLGELVTEEIFSHSHLS